MSEFFVRQLELDSDTPAKTRESKTRYAVQPADDTTGQRLLDVAVYDGGTTHLATAKYTMLETTGPNNTRITVYERPPIIDPANPDAAQAALEIALGDFATYALGRIDRMATRETP